jgi:hypothetical protein
MIPTNKIPIPYTLSRPCKVYTTFYSLVYGCATNFNKVDHYARGPKLVVSLPQEAGTKYGPDRSVCRNDAQSNRMAVVRLSFCPWKINTAIFEGHAGFKVREQ